MKAAVSLLTVLALGLSACAPSQTGSQSHSPAVQSSPDLPARVSPGTTAYVQYTYPRRALGIPKARFDELKINFGSGNHRDQGPEADAPWLRMGADNLPEGVQVALVRATIAKPLSDVDRSTYSVEVTYTEDVRVVLKVTAQPNAPVGLKTVALTFSDGAATGTVPLAVEVR